MARNRVNPRPGSASHQQEDRRQCGVAGALKCPAAYDDSADEREHA